MIVEDRIWLAAIMDTEGTLGLGRTRSKTKRKDGTDIVNVRYSVLLMITNTYLPLMERCQKLMGTNEVVQRRGKRFGNKPVYQVFLRQRNKVIEILREIEPYMMEKRQLAQRIIDWLEWFQEVRVSESGKRLSPANKRAMRDEYDARANYVREVMSTMKVTT